MAIEAYPHCTSKYHVGALLKFSMVSSRIKKRLLKKMTAGQRKLSEKFGGQSLDSFIFIRYNKYIK